MPSATYYRREFSQGDSYHRAEAPCVTTYQALFNGWSRFNSSDASRVFLTRPAALELSGALRGMADEMARGEVLDNVQGSVEP